MKKALLVFLGVFLTLSAYAAKDPMGLSEYVLWEVHGGHWTNPHTHPQYNPTTQTYYQERRLTNHEADNFRKLGFIKADGSIDTARIDTLYHKPAQPVLAPSATPGQTPHPSPQAVPQATPQAVPTPKPTSAKTSKMQKQQGPRRLTGKQVQNLTGIKHSNHPSHPKIQRKPLPTSQQIASQTKTKHVNHPKSKGTVHVRPTNFPNNPSKDDIVRMQRHIQYIERQVAKVLDLSLSAYAVAELPQATEGHSSLNIGVSSADGKTGEALGYSANFGDRHEYTVKINLSHAGHENAVGAGFGYQW